MINNYVDSLKAPYDYNMSIINIDSTMQSNARQTEDEQKSQILLRKI